MGGTFARTHTGNTSKCESALVPARGTAQRFAGDIENARQNRAGIERWNGLGTRFAFAGQNAETADVAALDEAKRLLKDGADSETVRQETGWFQGMDGKWRFEIDDSGMEYRRQGDMQSMRDPEYDKKRAIEYLKDKGYKAELTDNYHSGDIVAEIHKIVKNENEGVD